MKRYSAVLIREGAFRGVSPPKPIRFSRRVLASSFRSMEGKPLKLNHDSADAKVAGALVGTVRNVRFADDAIVGELVLDPKAPHYGTALAFIESQLALGGYPNVSIEGNLTPGADLGAEVEVADISFTALALVSRGACSDLAGCGVTAALSRGSTMDTNTATSTATVETTVEFTEVKDEPAKTAELHAGPCGCAEKKDDKAALAAEKSTLEAQLAEATKTIDTLKAELAAEKARAPLVAELAVVLPAFKPDGKTVSQLEAALEAARSLPVVEAPGRKTLLAEPEVVVNPREAALAAFVAKVDKHLR